MDLYSGIQPVHPVSAFFTTSEITKRGRRESLLPAESATLVCEGDRAVAEIPHDRAEHGEPPGAEDDIVPRQGHYIEISGERGTTNGQRGAADDADACDAFAVGYHSRETRSVL
jgi:hypothetical protein